MKITLRGKEVYVSDGSLDEKYASFRTSPHAVSCTSFINAEVIPATMLKKVKRKPTDKTLYLCDSAGHDDTRGV
jgi:hypothetical protein